MSPRHQNMEAALAAAFVFLRVMIAAPVCPTRPDEMPVEIERKFLVTGNAWRQGDGVHISQGYLNRDKERTVRVRVAGAKAFLTVKGATTGASRAEFEYGIPLAHGQELLKLCEPSIIEKIRRSIPGDSVTWEVDEFLGQNSGLVIAEVELQSETQTFAKPAWIGDEVTHDPRFFNSNLAAQPYSTLTQELRA